MHEKPKILQILAMLCKFYYTKLEINVNKNWFEECKTIILYYKKEINYKIVYKNNINKKLSSKEKREHELHETELMCKNAKIFLNKI